MSTPLSKIIAEYCICYVDDIRLQDLADTNPALFMRRASSYLLAAIPLFNLPAEMPAYLLGDKKYPKFIEPLYENKRYTVSGDKTEPFTIQLDEELIGYELFSAQILYLQGNSVITMPTSLCVYDRDYATITINASEENPVKDNTTFDFDFYTDGYFMEDLSPEIMSILAKCFNVVWQTRFNNDWLSNVSKTEDKSFFEQNRANKMNADTTRLNQLMNALNAEMSRFETNQYYRQSVSGNKRIRF